jgi:hypothetical protein
VIKFCLTWSRIGKELYFLEVGNKPSGSLKCGETVDYVRNG